MKLWEKHLKETNVEYKKLDEKESITENNIFRLKQEIEDLNRLDFETGFEEYKKDAKPVKPWSFTLTEKDVLKLKYIQSLHKDMSATIEFTPTAIGDFVAVRIDGESYDITDYEAW